ncbi:MAG: TonB-dependent siderophore receptor [Hyphomicrobium sp.]|nr:TonB-dependent siderophore receptor [Hyphomicrobium sp.]
MTRIFRGRSPFCVTSSTIAARSILALSASAMALTMCGALSRAQDAAPAEPSLPEVEVITPAEEPAQAAPKPAAPKPVAQAPKAKPKSTTQAPAAAPVPDVVAPEDASAAATSDAWPATGNSNAPGVPGTGTTGIDGYIATGTSTATKTNTPLIDIPQSITVITAQQAEDRGSFTVGEALRYVPGIAVAQGEGHRDQISLRGQVTTADFFVDGVRDDIEYFRDLYNVETIEVLKGPAAMIFGRGGGGGVVNRVTKKANGERIREVTATAGSFERARTTIDVGDKISPDAAFRLNAMYEDSESFRDFFELERYGINPTLAFRPDDSTKISLSYEYFNDGRTVDRGVPSFNGRPSRGPIETFFGNPDVSYSDFEGHTATATLEHRFDNGVNFRNHTFLATYDKVYQNVFAASAVTIPGACGSPVTGCVTLGGYINGTERDTVVNQTDATYIWDMGNGIRHTLLAGTEFSYQDTTNFRNNPTFAPGTNVVPFNNPTSFAPVAFNVFQRDWQTEVSTYSGYIQDQLEITKYFELIGGLRFDRFDVAFDGTTAGVNGGNPQSLSRVDDVWSHRVGAVFKPIETASVYIATSNSFLPGAGDQFGNLTTVSGDTLEPEEFLNNEIGFKWEVAPRLFFTGAIFELDRENQLVVVGTTPTGANISEQVGLTRTRGGELSLTGYVTDEWQISAGWGHQIARIVEAGTSSNEGNEVPFVPNNIYSLWNRYQFTPLFGAGLGIIHQDSSFAEANNAVELPSFTRVDAAFYFDFNENWQAQVNVENIFDEEYFASAHNNNNISPGAPRQAFVTVRARF